MKILIVILLVGALGAGGWYYTQRQRAGAVPQVSTKVDTAIIDEAEKAGCDMIVMVTHGRGPIGEFLFGSHTKNIIARSKLPVLVLH